MENVIPIGIILSFLVVIIGTPIMATRGDFDAEFNVYVAMAVAELVIAFFGVLSILIIYAIS